MAYDIDISQPIGSRIVNLTYQGNPVPADQKFVLAINNYRQQGGGGFPHIATAPVVYNAQVGVRDAMIAFASATGVIDPADFHTENWRLVHAGIPIL